MLQLHQVAPSFTSGRLTKRPRIGRFLAHGIRNKAARKATRLEHHDPLRWAEHHGLTLWGQCDCPTCGGWEPRRDRFGPSHTQADIWRSVRDHRETYVHAGHAEGKTWTAGAIACWWMDTFHDGIVITTASSWTQVKRQLWKEIRRLHGRLDLEGEAHHLHWELREDHYAQGISTNDVNNLRGFHEGRVLFIIDEGSGVDPEVFDAADQVLTGDHDRLLVLTNPVRRASVTFERLRENRGSHLRLSVPDCLSWQDAHPDIKIPGLVSWTWMEQVATESWGINSAKYRVHVLALYPESDERYLFPPDLVGAAMDRFEARAKGLVATKGVHHEPLTSPDQMGVDVAGVGRDKTVWAARFGDRLIAFPFTESVTNHRDHRLRVDDFHHRHKPGIWVWDAGGEGSGTEHELLGMEIPVDRFTGSQIPEEPTKYRNRRAEAYFHLRDFLRNGGAIPNNPDLRRQLQAIEGKLAEVTVDDERHTVYALEPGEKLKETLNRSPDEADACALAVTPPSWSGRPAKFREHSMA